MHDFKTSRRLAVVAAVAALHAAASFAKTDELDAVKKRLLGARKQGDITRIYEEVERRFDGDTVKISAYLQRIGFSCVPGRILYRIKCVYSYCGDRRIFPLIFQREFISVGVIITEKGTSTDLVHHNATECPATDALLRAAQEKLLNGGIRRDGK